MFWKKKSTDDKKACKITKHAKSLLELWMVAQNMISLIIVNDKK